MDVPRGEGVAVVGGVVGTTDSPAEKTSEKDLGVPQ